MTRWISVRACPYGYKYRRGVRKFLLRQAVADLVPEVVLKRAKKGFGIPLTPLAEANAAPLPLEAVSGHPARLDRRTLVRRQQRTGR
jgi:hypothetical protein